MPRLVVNPRSPDVWEIPLKPGPNSIGRGFANDFKITDASVSTAHCQVVVGEQSVMIKDLGSTNGTFVNRTPVREAVLLPGQVVHLGNVEMVYYADGPAPAVLDRALAVAVPVPAKPLAEVALPPPPVLVEAPLFPAAKTVVQARIHAVPAPGAIPAQPASPAPAASATRITIQARIQPPPAPNVPPIAVPAPIALRPIGTVGIPVPPPLTSARAGGADIPIPARMASPSAAPAREIPRSTPGESPSEPAADGPRYCRFHPKLAARFLCRHCQESYCDSCVALRQLAGVPRKFCRQCGAELTTLKLQIQRVVEKGFFERVPGAFAYPVRGVGLLIVFAGIVLFALLRWGLACVQFRTARMVVFGIILEIFAGGYLFTYLQSILHSTTAEDRELPDLPGISNFLDDVLMPFFRLLGLILFCFGPALGLGIWYALSKEMPVGLGALGALFLGFLYFPMGFLAVAILDSIIAANPLLVVPSMLKVALEYLFTLACFAIVLSVQFFGNRLIKYIFPTGIVTHSMGQLFAWLGSVAALSFLTLYLLIVGVHILGLIFAAKKDQLGWLNR